MRGGITASGERCGQLRDGASASLNNRLLRRLDLQRIGHVGGDQHEADRGHGAHHEPRDHPRRVAPPPIEREQNHRQIGRGGNRERERHQVGDILALGEDADGDGERTHNQ